MPQGGHGSLPIDPKCTSSGPTQDPLSRSTLTIGILLYPNTLAKAFRPGLKLFRTKAKPVPLNAIFCCLLCSKAIIVSNHIRIPPDGGKHIGGQLHGDLQGFRNMKNVLHLPHIVGV